MTPVATKQRMNAEEFFDWADEDTRADLINGEVHVHSPVSLPHSRLTNFIHVLLLLYVQKHDLGEVHREGWAIREIARIIRPRGRLVFTSFDYTGRPVGRPAQVSDHQPLLKEAGFRILAYEETEDWHHRLKATGDALLAAADELAAESGEDPGTVEAEVREMTETLAFVSRRVFVVAERH